MNITLNKQSIGLFKGYHSTNALDLKVIEHLSTNFKLHFLEFSVSSIIPHN